MSTPHVETHVSGGHTVTLDHKSKAGCIYEATIQFVDTKEPAFVLKSNAPEFQLSPKDKPYVATFYFKNVFTGEITIIGKAACASTGAEEG